MVPWCSLAGCSVSSRALLTGQAPCFQNKTLSLKNFYPNSRVTLCDSVIRIARGTIPKPYELQIIRLQLYRWVLWLKWEISLHRSLDLLQNLFLLWAPVTAGTTGNPDRYSGNGRNNTFLCCLSGFQKANIFAGLCDFILGVEGQDTSTCLPL